MTSLETLQQMFHDNEKLSSSEHKNIVDKIEHIEKQFGAKIVVLEASAKEFQSWKNYIIGIVALISFAVPIGLNFF